MHLNCDKIIEEYGDR